MAISTSSFPEVFPCGRARVTASSALESSVRSACPRRAPEAPRVGSGVSGSWFSWVSSSGQSALAGAARGGILWRSRLPCLRWTLGGGVSPALSQPGNASTQVERIRRSLSSSGASPSGDAARGGGRGERGRGPFWVLLRLRALGSGTTSVAFSGFQWAPGGRSV